MRDTILLCFPPEDVVFSEAARRAFLAYDDGGPTSVEAVLRARYPQVLVRERDPLASFGKRAWYLYRDGRYSPFASDHHWWTDPSVAWVVISQTGEYLDANPAALSVLGTTVEGLRAAAPGSFSVAAQRSTRDWTLQLLLDAGELHSTATLHPVDGGPDVPVEFHLTRDGAGNGKHVSAFRPLPQSEPDEGA